MRERSRRALCVVWVALALASAALTARGEEPCFTQINADGFGNPKNTYAWSMKAFRDHLYVGTLNKAAVGGIADLELDGGGLRPAARRDVTGAQLWRYDGSVWTQVVPDGFGSKNNEGIRNLAVYGDALYAGTLNPLGGAEVWRSTDGSQWVRVGKNGLGNILNSSIRGMVAWRDKLWVGTVNQLGGELHSFDGSTWTKVAKRGIDEARNDTLADLRVHGDDLFVATWNGQGARLYRFDGVTWTSLVGGSAATAAGFGDPENTGILSLASFRGALYASTRNFDTGFSVWRTMDAGATWQQVVANGFGDARQRYGWKLFVFGDELYLGTFVSGDSGPDQYTLGGRLYRTADGTTWSEEVGPAGIFAPAGFGDGRNYGVRSMESYFGELHLGTAQCFFCTFPVTGAEIWHRDPAGCGG